MSFCKAQSLAVIGARASSRTSQSALHDGLRLLGREQAELGENVGTLARSNKFFI